MSFSVLEHIADPITFLQCTLKMLKVSGKLIICVPNNDALINKDKESPLNLPPHHMGLWNKQSLIFLGKALNIKVEQHVNEPLQIHHIDWYVRTLLKKLAGESIYHRIISEDKYSCVYSKENEETAKNIIGHSILFVSQNECCSC